MTKKILLAIVAILVAVNILLLFMAVDRTHNSPQPLRRYISGTNIKSLRYD